MKCKYYNPKMDTLKKVCGTLYKLPGCEAGGLLHILLDDNNYDDASLLFCLKECLLHPEHPSSRTGVIICHEYLKMSIRERSVFDWYRCGNDLECCENCDKCKLIEE